MKEQSLLHSVEQFHLLFLDHIGRKMDKRSYAVKGGCNLRFFLKSIRYSQDIDIDVQTVRKDTLQNSVNKTLISTPFSLVLRSKGIEIEDVSEPKQTETTQRWKVKLLVTGANATVNTKIEFSRRGLTESAQFEAVDSAIIQTYRLVPIMANHYTKESAFKQKIAALAFRNETQARIVLAMANLFAVITWDVFHTCHFRSAD
jgi:Domain of unknown function (DUF1814).